MSDALDLEPIKKREAVETPGPWEPDDSEVYVAGSRDWVAESLRSGDGYAQGVKDADFIAHAREDVPKLIAEVERLRAEVERLDKRAETTEKELRMAWRVADNAKAELVMIRKEANRG